MSKKGDVVWEVRTGKSKFSYVSGGEPIYPDTGSLIFRDEEGDVLALFAAGTWLSVGRCKNGIPVPWWYGLD
jgi:hypothetical protein